jgi:CRP-like cAMP-binding protein
MTISTPSPNKLLASLPPDDLALLQPHLRHVELRRGDVLIELDEPITYAYFPFSGIVSLVAAIDEGLTVEVALVGSGGIAGLSAVLSGIPAPSRAIVQIAGSGARIAGERLRALYRQSEALRTVLLRYNEVLFGRVQQTAVCNAGHKLEARLCRWMLQARDLTGSDQLMLTQEFLAQMLGAQRSTVNLVAQTLRQAGLIDIRRGSVQLLDIDGIRGVACECYGVLREHYARIFPEFALADVSTVVQLRTEKY